MAVFFSAVGSALSLNGETLNNPAKISISKPVSVISDGIQIGNTDKFYQFYWNESNNCSATVALSFGDVASNESSYTVELIGPTGVATPLLWYLAIPGDDSLSNINDQLNAADDYTLSFAAAGSPATGYYDLCDLDYPPTGGCGLGAGNYEIGIIGNTSVDPVLTIDFASPVFAVSGVPEPATWAMMLMGIGGLGAVLRGSRRRLGAVAARR